MLQDGEVRLRALEPEDLEWLYTVENDTDLWRWGNANVPYSRYVLKTYIAESRHDIYADGQLRLAITSACGDEVMAVSTWYILMPAICGRRWVSFFFPTTVERVTVCGS